MLGGLAQDSWLPDSVAGTHQQYLGHTAHHSPQSSVGLVYCCCGALGGRVRCARGCSALSSISCISRGEESEGGVVELKQHYLRV